jgi:4-hydroxyphenylpyruvate dioxygenase
MRKGIATVSISGTLPEKLEAISAAKFEGIEIFDNDLIASTLSPGEVARRCADLGLEIDLFQPIRDLEGLHPARFAAALRRVAVKFDVMEQLGVTTALVCSNATPEAVDDLDLSAEQLAKVGDLAREHGFTLAFEALAWGTHVGRVGQAWEIVRRADHESVGVAIDTFHLLARGDDASALADVPGDRIAFLQIADAPHLATHVLEWSRHHRCFPGQGGFDLAAIVGTVVERGYRGPLSLEIFSDIVREADPHATALDAMRSLLHLQEELRRRWDPAGPAARPRVRLFDPPPPRSGWVRGSSRLRSPTRPSWPARAFSASTTSATRSRST